MCCDTLLRGLSNVWPLWKRGYPGYRCLDFRLLTSRAHDLGVSSSPDCLLEDAYGLGWVLNRTPNIDCYWVGAVPKV